MPEWRGRVGLWWNYDKYTAGATVNYVDSFDQLYGVIAEVASHTTLDLQASYDLTDNSTDHRWCVERDRRGSALV